MYIKFNCSTHIRSNKSNIIYSTHKIIEQKISNQEDEETLDQP
jgi:hypothetical protein